MISTMTYLRLSRSPSSPAISMAAMLDSGLWDRSEELWDDRTVVFSWYVLNENWGPIQRRLFGPTWVIISTCKTIYTVKKPFQRHDHF